MPRQELRYETTRIMQTRLVSNSRNGNPIFDVWFEDLPSARTQIDAACAIGIENRELNWPNWVRVGFTRAGRIATIEQTSPDEPDLMDSLKASLQQARDQRRSSR